jgi:hypothetical protein
VPKKASSACPIFGNNFPVSFGWLLGLDQLGPVKIKRVSRKSIKGKYIFGHNLIAFSISS